MRRVATGVATLMRRVLGLRDSLERWGLSKKLFLAGFVLYVLWKLITLSVVSPEEGSTVHTVTHLACLALFGLSILLSFRLDKEFLLFLIAAALGIACKISSDYVLFFDLALIFGAARNTDIKTILKAWVITTSVGVLVIIAASQLGIIVDYLFSRDDAVRHGLGFRYATYASHLLLMITLVHFYLRKSKLTIFECIVALGANVYIYALTVSRNAFVLSLLVVAIGFALRYEPVQALIPKGFLRFAGQYSFVVMLVLGVVMTAAYDSESQFWTQVNDQLNNRLSSTQAAYETYDILPFGQDIDMVGMGLAAGEDLVTQREMREDGDTNYVDNAYLFVLLTKGYIWLAALMVLWMCAGHQASKRLDPWGCATLAIISIHMFVDNTFVQLVYNPFLLLAWKETCTCASSLNCVWRGRMEPNPAENRKTYLTHEEIQREEFDLLLRFDTFCNEHDLHYSLDYGTLLGAVRHKGFIPWDDDIDLSMSRPELERLLSLADELPEDMKLLTVDNSQMWYLFPKVITTRVRSQETSYEGVFEEYLWLDIFPVDGVPSDDEGLAREWAWGKNMHKYLQRRVRPNSGPWWKRAIKYVMTFASRKRDVRAETSDKLKEALTVERYESSERVASLLCLQQQPWSLDKEAYERTVLMEFEGHMLPVMSCWHEQLSSAYPGDYMQLPPEDQRKVHAIRAWKVEDEEPSENASLTLDA